MQQQVNVSERAVMQRINRRLTREDKRIHRARRWPEHLKLGKHYIIDELKNVVCDSHVFIEQYAREIGAMQPWECLVS